MKPRTFFQTPKLTSTRVALALGVAMVADGIQIAVGPMGWVGVVQIVDAVAAILTFMILGFHVLLLPTFIVELFPVVDMMPTWTACVAAVIALRKREERLESAKDVTPPQAQIENPSTKE